MIGPLNTQIDLWYQTLPLEDLIGLPTTVSFLSTDSDRFERFADEHPYVRIGPRLRGGYVVAYTDESKIFDVLRELGQSFLDGFPVAYITLDTESLSSAGITRVQQMPNIDLRGRDVLIGFVDTGIDYTQPAFLYEDGTSKIRYIWDQTIPGAPPPDMPFGTVYDQSQINEALRAEDPLSVVPHQDTIGHGTFLASLAGGREPNEYMGAAPDAEIIAVKLKKASPFLVQTTAAPAVNENIFQSADIMMGLKFILDKADEMERPVAICLALGSNFGAHDGLSLMEKYITALCNRRGVVICTAAGNESNARHHTNGLLPMIGAVDDIEIRVGGDVQAFTVYIWNTLWDRVSVSVQSPTGQLVDRIPHENNMIYTRALTLERSVIAVGYYQLEGRMTIVQVYNPTEGIWHIRLTGDTIISGAYHAWLPITGMISPEVEFLNPVPNYTIVNPATAIGTITCGAYNSRDNSLFVGSSWGPTNLPRISPDFVAPGVNVGGVFPTGTGTMTGTSAAAAITTGASALLLQWGIVQGHEADMDCNRVRSLLIRGCERDSNRQYPDMQWGYGRLSLISTFNSLR